MQVCLVIIQRKHVLLQQFESPLDSCANVVIEFDVKGRYFFLFFFSSVSSVCTTRNEKRLRPSSFLISSSSFPIHFARLTLFLDHLSSACSTPFSLTHTSVIVGVFCSVLSEGGAWSNACFLLSSIERACVIVD